MKQLPADIEAKYFREYLLTEEAPNSFSYGRKTDVEKFYEWLKKTGRISE